MEPRRSAVAAEDMDTRGVIAEVTRRTERGTAADGFADLYADRIRFTGADGTVIEGRERLLDYLRREEAAFPAGSMAVRTIAVDGDTGVLAWTSTTRHDAALTLPSGTVLPATGRVLTIEGVNVLRVADGKVVESRRYYDRLGLMAQLGLLPG